MADNEGGDRASDDCGGLQVVHDGAHARPRPRRTLPRLRRLRQGVRPPEGHRDQRG